MRVGPTVGLMKTRGGFHVLLSARSLWNEQLQPSVHAGGRVEVKQTPAEERDLNGLVDYTI